MERSQQFVVRRQRQQQQQQQSSEDKNKNRICTSSSNCSSSSSTVDEVAAASNRKRFFYRTLEPPDDNDLDVQDSLSASSSSPHFSSQELELLSTLDKGDAATGSLLFLPPDDEDDCSSGSSDSSGSSLSTMAELQREQQEAVLLSTTQHQGGVKRLSVFPTQEQRIQSANYLQQYMAKRHMTPTQERWNAITMIPSPLYCLYFLLSGCWVSQSMVEQARLDLYHKAQYSATATAFEATAAATAARTATPATSSGFEDFANNALGDINGCLSPSLFWWLPHNMPALPPMTLIAVAIGICCHAPFSFLYHWRYAHALPAGAARTTHWSRRMDQSMIHFCSACMSYATSGSWDFFIANVLFNAECIYCQFKRKVRPRRNKIRIIISIIAYTIPILRRGDLDLYVRLVAVLGLSGWFFIYYPIGGWSHAAFHVLAAFCPPLLMMAATELPMSQVQLQVAATCAALREQQQQQQLASGV